MTLQLVLEKVIMRVSQGLLVHSDPAEAAALSDTRSPALQ